MSVKHSETFKSQIEAVVEYAVSEDLDISLYEMIGILELIKVQLMRRSLKRKE